MLITTLLVIDQQPGLKTAEIAEIVVPDEAARRPGYIGWWFGSYLKKWHKAGFVKRLYSSKKKRGALRYFPTLKGMEALLSLGLKRV